MRALVTGCAGFIGSNLADSLLADGFEVVGVDCFNDNYGRAQKRRNLESALDWAEFEFVPLDLARGDLRELVEECDVVFHLAAEPGVRASWGERFESYQRNNLMATQHLLEAAKHCADKPFVYAGSSSVYGQAETFPTAEDTLPQPFSPYGVTKLAAEHLCSLYHGNYGVRTVTLRYFSVYGPRQRPDMAFNRFMRAALVGEPLTVFGDGGQSRDFTFVGDIVQATRAAATTPAAVGGIYNVGGGNRVTLNDVLEIIGEIAERPLDVRRPNVERGGVRDTGADTNRGRAVLGSAPENGLRDSL
ncbi:MAG: NAD-dependent epimerase/dehydratase family protein, partial [Solirubrobacteraceae bacterium]